MDRQKLLRNAEKLVSKGKIDAAIKQYRKALDSSPRDTTTLNRVGDLYVRAKRLDEAMELFHRAAEHFSDEGFFVKAIAIYKKILRLDPGQMPVYEKLADLYHRQGLSTEAKNQYEVVADYHLKHEDLASAIAVHVKIVEIVPNDATQHLRLAELYQQAGRHEDALAQYREIAVLMLEHGKVEEALRVYRSALEVDASDLGFVEAGVALLKQGGHVAAARELMSCAVELNPDAASISAFDDRRGAAEAEAAAELEVVEPEAAEIEIEIEPEEDVAEEAPTPEPEPEPVAEEEEEIEIVIEDAVEVEEPVEEAPEEAVAEEEVVAEEVFKPDEESIEIDLGALALEEEEESKEPEPPVAEVDSDELASALAEAEAAASVEATDEEEVEVEIELDIDGMDETEPVVEVVAEEPEPEVEVEAHEEVEEEIEIVVEPMVEVEAEEAEPPAVVSPDELMPAPEGVAASPHREDPDEIDLLAEATVLASYGLFGKAIDRLQELLSNSPNRLDVRERLVEVFIDQGSMGLAADEATELARLCFENEARDVWARLRGVLVKADFRIEQGKVLPPLVPEPVVEVAPEPAPSAPVEEVAPAEAIEETVEAPTDVPEVAFEGWTEVPAEAAPAPAAEEVELPVEVEVEADPKPTVSPAPEVTPEAEPQWTAIDPVEEVPIAADPQFADPQFEAFDPMDLPSGNAEDFAPPAEWLSAEAVEPADSVEYSAADDLFSEEDEFFDLAAELEEELDRDGVLPAGELISDIQEQSLDDIVEGFRKGVAEALSPEDFDTHYNLGIAYREMGLVDEAIGEFQLAAKDPRYLVDCCSHLAACFVDKGFPELAIKWFERGLASPAIEDSEVLGLRYELGNLYEETGDRERAYNEYVEIYGANSHYRDIVAKLEELRKPVEGV